MKPQAKKTPYKRIALALSLCALLIWAILGTGASLAWFTDTSPEINNIFHFAEFDLVVSHRLTDGKWQEVDSQTKIFDEEGNAREDARLIQQILRLPCPIKLQKGDLLRKRIEE